MDVKHSPQRIFERAQQVRDLALHLTRVIFDSDARCQLAHARRSAAPQKMISCAATKILFDERPRSFSEYCGSA